MTKTEVLRELKAILEDSPIQRDRILGLIAHMEAKPKRNRNRRRGEEENTLAGWADIILGRGAPPVPEAVPPGVVLRGADPRGDEDD